MPSGTGRPGSIAPRRTRLLAVVGWLGFGWRVLDLLASGAFQFTEPLQVFTNGPGIWVTGIGLVILARAAYRMTREPAYR